VVFQVLRAVRRRARELDLKFGGPKRDVIQTVTRLHERILADVLRRMRNVLLMKKKYRILLMVEKTLVPPEDISGMSETQIDDFRTEYDVLHTLRRPGHEVRVVGIGDHLTELRETIDEWKPHVVFNLLDEFSGIISYDHYVVAYLELVRNVTRAATRAA